MTFPLLILGALAFLYLVQRAGQPQTRDDNTDRRQEEGSTKKGGSTKKSGSSSTQGDSPVTEPHTPDDGGAGMPALSGTPLGPPPDHPRVERRQWRGVNVEIYWTGRTQGGGRIPPGFVRGQGKTDAVDVDVARYLASVGSPPDSRVPVRRSDKGWRVARYEYHNEAQRKRGVDAEGNIHIITIFPQG